MARASKSNVLKFKTKTKSEITKKATRQVRDGKKKIAKSTEASVEVAVTTTATTTVTTVVAAAETKPKIEGKVSQKLLETIERRRKQGEAKGNGLFTKPAGRRGRRPKAVSEYVPGNNEEEAYVLENDYEGIEYDTGIRVKNGGEDRNFGFERLEDFDEELNFDW